MRYVTLFVTTVAVLFAATNEASAIGSPPVHGFLGDLIELWNLMSQVFGS